MTWWMRMILSSSSSSSVVNNKNKKKKYLHDGPVLFLLFFLLLVELPSFSSSLSSSSSSSSSQKKTTTLPTVVQPPTIPIQSKRASQIAMIDGSEWISIQRILQEEQKTKSTSKYGFMKVVTGQNQDNQRIVALQAADVDDDTTTTTTTTQVYQDSIAMIPDSVSDKDAIATCIVSLAAIHCTMPRENGIGGSSTMDVENSFVSGKVVILGGNEIACYAAHGLASLGIQVSLVSTGNPKVKQLLPSSSSSSKNNNNAGKIDILKPAVGQSKEGFASVIGNFDSLLDTTHDERPTSIINGIQPLEEMNDNNWGNVIGLLKSRHGCHRYVSTVTQSQRLVGEKGVMFGPRKADEYIQKVSNPSILSSPDCQQFPPPANMGKTLETLLQQGAIFTDQQMQQIQPKKKSSAPSSSSILLRGWSLSDFWEQTTWPRDSSEGNVRFGLPVVDDEEEDDEEDDEYMIAAPPSRTLDKKWESTSREEEYAVLKEEQSKAPKNPYVLDIIGVRGIQDEIANEELDCLLFLSATWCKTCKSLTPQYNRMARQKKEDISSPVVFARADTSGLVGKEVGRYLEVDAVPAFVLFRRGKVFGSPLSVSRLPSTKISKAMELLESGQDWDSTILGDEA